MSRPYKSHLYDDSIKKQNYSKLAENSVNQNMAAKKTTNQSKKTGISQKTTNQSKKAGIRQKPSDANKLQDPITAKPTVDIINEKEISAIHPQPEIGKDKKQNEKIKTTTRSRSPRYKRKPSPSNSPQTSPRRQKTYLMDNQPINKKAVQAIKSTFEEEKKNSNINKLRTKKENTHKKNQLSPKNTKQLQDSPKPQLNKKHRTDQQLQNQKNEQIISKENEEQLENIENKDEMNSEQQQQHEPVIIDDSINTNELNDKRINELISKMDDGFKEISIILKDDIFKELDIPENLLFVEDA